VRLTSKLPRVISPAEEYKQVAYSYRYEVSTSSVTQARCLRYLGLGALDVHQNKGHAPPIISKRQAKISFSKVSL
jgi:hypothetical protein